MQHQINGLSAMIMYTHFNIIAHHHHHISIWNIIRIQIDKRLLISHSSAENERAQTTKWCWNFHNRIIVLWKTHSNERQLFLKTESVLHAANQALCHRAKNRVPFLYVTCFVHHLWFLEIFSSSWLKNHLRKRFLFIPEFFIML